MMVEQRIIDPPLHAIDRAMLGGPVSALLGYASAQIVDWQVERINPGMGTATGGIYRVAGTALGDGCTLRWALMIKVMSLGASTLNPATREIDHPLYWKREVLVYQSGLLTNLPGGVEAPRCLAVTRRPGDVLWLWMEEAHDRYGPIWPLEQYHSAARCLGRFNGTYLAVRPIPAYPWLCGPATLRGMVNHFLGLQEVLHKRRTWEQPLVRRAFPASIVDRLLRLWSDRGPLLDALERLPLTLCHKDAWRRNMFAPSGPSERDRLVMIDWSYVGSGEIGMDAGDLFAASYSLFGVEPCAPRELDQAVFESYLEGLGEAGWRGDRRTARFGYTAYAALKYCSVLLWLSDVGDEKGQALWERLVGRPIDEHVENQGRLVAYLLELADEARTLIDA
jgi:hypothetical protein